MSRGPLHRWAPPAYRTFGDIAAKVGRDLGLDPDAEQRWLLDTIYAEKAPGIPAAFQVCAVAPRQNLKTAAFEIAALTDLFVLGVPLSVWTAHEFKTARKAFEDMRTRIVNNPEFESRCYFRDSHGEEAITLHTGEKIEFHARSTGSGRGFSCDRLTLDEALFLRPADMGALLPILVTRRDAQVRLGSSAGFATSEVLQGIRDRGRAGGDMSLAYVEYGADRKPCGQPRCGHKVGTPGCALDDRALWWQANSAMWVDRITEEALEHNRKALPPVEFMREFLSWWEDSITGGVFAPKVWENLTDPESTIVGPLSFAVDMTPDRSAASIAVAGLRADGLRHAEVVEHRRGSGWAAGRLAELVGRHGGHVLLDPGGPAGGLIPSLAEVGVEVLPVSTRDYAQACGNFFDLVTSGGLRHLGQQELNDAVTGARMRSLGDAWVWNRKHLLVDISPLVAVSLAVFAVTTAEPVKKPIFLY